MSFFFNRSPSANQASQPTQLTQAEDSQSTSQSRPDYVKANPKLDGKGFVEGAIKNTIYVEIRERNGTKCNTHLTPQDQLRLFKYGLKLPRDYWYGCTEDFQKGPAHIYRLSKPIDVEHYLGKNPWITFEGKAYGPNTEPPTYKCYVRGLSSDEKFREDPNSTLKWIRIEGGKWRVETRNIEEFLTHFGELQTQLEQKIIYISDDESDMEEDVAMATGKFAIKINMKAPIP